MWKISSHTENGTIAKLFLDRRGIATTEAVIVIPFFLIVWMGLVTVHHVYEKRLEVQVASARRAMSISVGGCKGGPPAGPEDLNEHADAANANMESENSQSSGFLSQIGGDQPFAWTHTSGGKTLTASGIPGLFGGPERSVKASQKFMCNMEPKEGLWEMLVDMMRSALGWD